MRAWHGRNPRPQGLYFRANAYAAIDAGAVLVLGHHAHVLQGVEAYKGGLIAYGLVNFVFDGIDGVSNETVIPRVTLTRAGVPGYEWAPAIIRQGARYWWKANRPPAS